jgi:inorganic pyrophosphatase
MHSHLRPVCLPVAFLLTALATLAVSTGCSSMTIAAKEKVFGIAKRDQLVARVKDTREAQQDAKKEFQSALDQFLALSGGTGTQLESTYKKLNAKYESSKDAVDTVKSRITKVQDVSNALFREWQQEIGTYSNQSLKADSQAKLDSTKAQYNQLLGVMKDSEARMEPVLNTFREQVMYLKHNLNAQAISGLMQRESAGIQTEVTRLIADMQRSIDEADAFIAQMKSN